ncbi:alpha/beta fold hydrolase, partial [Streptomyces sp. BR123]|uniref:alpha/beta fold hydrolase n=1 Tax=Streptomyces sp. BR123 TaxID=2749828 RepID=UPI0015C46E43
MGNFVLVPGAWLGAWAWDAVAAELRAAGHDVHPLTLSGLAERREAGAWAGQQTHVHDIVDAVECLDLHDVVLVGHSYSGIPVGQAAELIGDRLARVVFVDADVPVDGESFVSGWPG